MGGKSKKPKQRVTEYRMSIQYGVCQGPVDSLSRVFLNEKSAWEGAQVIEGAFTVNDIDLFGGIKKEGGVDGRVYFQPGSFTQKLSEKAAGKLGLTPDTAPGYRGVCTALFTDRPPPTVSFGSGFLGDLLRALFLKNRPRGYDRPGFYWAANQPFIAPAWFTVTRIPKGWYPETARISKDADKPFAVYFAIDNSGSMQTGSRLATMKTAMNAVLDLIAQAISSFGLSVDVGIAQWAETNFQEQVFENATLANISTLRSFVNGIDGDGGGTDFNTAATGAKAFFDAGVNKDLARRVFVFITDGEPTDDSDDVAASTIADLLNQSSGQFNTQNGTAVDCYGINIELPDVSATAKLDNTSSDDVPIVSSDDPSELLSAMQSALFAGQLGDANPIHMIRECLTDRSWGMGSPESSIDDVSFRAAAETLFQEKFGLSMIWTQQAQIEEFIREILDHIEANLIVDPADGLFKIKLIRDDIEPGTLPVFDESNCVVDSFQIRSPAEIINEINVTWTDPENEQDSVYTAQDLGGVVANGGEIKSDNRNYYGVRNVSLAAKLAARDIAVVTAPVATAEITTDRTAWRYTPGDAIKLTASDYGADEVVMRILKVDYGEPRRPEIKLSLTQDIFSFAQPVFEEPAETEFEPPEKAPAPAEFTKVVTLNYYLAGLLLDSTSVQDVEYPDVFLMVLASTSVTDTQEIELVGELPDAAGNTSQQILGTRELAARGALENDFAQEAITTAASFGTLTVGQGPAPGAIGLIGPEDGTEADMEMVLFKSFDGTDWTLARGVLDTVPRAWPAGTPIRFVSESTFVEDDEVRSAAETVTYKVLTRTSLGLLNGADAPDIAYTATERPHLPHRPANVAINGLHWSLVDAEGLATIPVTWVNRNRVTEDSQVLDWDAASVTPETGQTTVIKIVDPSTAAVLNTINVAEGVTSHDLVPADFSGASLALVQVFASRDGFESLQAYEQLVLLSGGYGRNYGYLYGGT